MLDKGDIQKVEGRGGGVLQDRFGKQDLDHFCDGHTNRL